MGCQLLGFGRKHLDTGGNIHILFQSPLNKTIKAKAIVPICCLITSTLKYTQNARVQIIDYIMTTVN